MREDRIKAHLILDAAASIVRQFDIVRETRFLVRASGPRSPIATALTNDGGILVLDNNGGLVFTIDGHGMESLRLSDRLMFPSMLRLHGGRLYVADNAGLSVFAEDGRKEMGVRSFLAMHDFVVLDEDHIAVNPVMNVDDAPTVALVQRSIGSMVKRWGRRGAGSVARVTRRAHLAACRQGIVVGLAHLPEVYILTTDLGSERRLKIAFPGTSELAALSADRRLAEPAPGVVTLPTFIGGVACMDERVFVLFDLPKLTILEYRVDGTLLSVYYADVSIPKRHYFRLSAISDSRGQLRLVTIAEDENGHRAVVEAILMPTKRDGT